MKCSSCRKRDASYVLSRGDTHYMSCSLCRRLALVCNEKFRTERKIYCGVVL